MLESNPVVTIGLPVYNGEKYIKEALTCLLSQTFKDFVIVISDNASVDSTEDICREFAAQDSRVLYVKHKINSGPAKNFEYVMQQAKTEFFMWAAADDRWHPDFLQRTLEVMKEDDACGLVFSEFSEFNLLNGEAKRIRVASSASGSIAKNYLYRLMVPCPNFIYGLHRLSVLKNIGVKSYDYFDIHLTHWYTINSVVKVIPLVLFKSGVVGERVPYSLTGNNISIKEFLRAEWRMLKGRFPVLVAVFLFSICAFSFAKDLKRINKKFHL